MKFLGKEDKFTIYDYYLLINFLAISEDAIKKYFTTNKIT
jgi:hypothetical protein